MYVLVVSKIISFLKFTYKLSLKSTAFTLGNTRGWHIVCITVSIQNERNVYMIPHVIVPLKTAGEKINNNFPRMLSLTKRANLAIVNRHFVYIFDPDYKGKAPSFACKSVHYLRIDILFIGFVYRLSLGTSLARSENMSDFDWSDKNLFDQVKFFDPIKSSDIVQISLTSKIKQLPS